MTASAARAARSSAAALFLAAASGCATASLPPPELVARVRSTRSYSARLRVSLRGPDVRVRTAVLVAFQRPDQLRLEVPGPTGLRLVAVTRAGELAAVFPPEKAVFQGEASESELKALLGLALTPPEVMDLLLGSPSPRLRRYRARWGPTLPRRIEAVLPDGGQLKVTVEDAEPDVVLPAAAFLPPPHAGYRAVDAAEARALWGGR